MAGILRHPNYPRFGVFQMSFRRDICDGKDSTLILKDTIEFLTFSILIEISNVQIDLRVLYIDSGDIL